MKLIKQALLAYQGGNSDKVYEVDLCEVGTDQYVVNFRYGRRGAALKEGSKTPLPVNRDKAEKAFDTLVNSKLKKGYYDTQAGISVPETASVAAIEEASPAVVTLSDPRKQAVLDRLAASFQAPEAKNQKPANKGVLSWLKPSAKKTNKPTAWPLDRIIWRAGELAISEAEPYLLRLLDPQDQERNYCVIYALGRCGSEASVLVLQRFYATQGTPDMLKRLAGEALYACLSDSEREKFQAQRLAALPKSVQTALQASDTDALQTLVTDILAAGKADDYWLLTQLYQYARHDASQNSPARTAHSVLLNLLRDAPLKPNWFKRIRHIFKLAEYREDGAMFGLLAYRFDKQGAAFNISGWGGVRFQDEKGRYHYLDDDELQRHMASPKSHLAYSNKTRDYLRRRVWRTLRRLGEQEAPSYVVLATEILLHINDSDAQAPQAIRLDHWDYRDNDWHHRVTTSHFDRFAAYWSFNHILYQNSPRYEPTSTYRWRCRGDYRPDMVAPEGVLEEAFPTLWRQVPEKLLHLLQHSHCQPVHDFAVRALGDCEAFCQQLSLDTLAALLHSLYESTAQFAFDLASPRYNPKQPQSDLVLAALSCVAPKAREAAQAWVAQGRTYFLQDSAFLAAFISNEHADTRAFAEQFLRSASLSDTVAQALLGRLVGELLILSEEQQARAADIHRILRQTLGPQLRLLSLPVLEDLLRAPAVAVRELAADVLLNHYSAEEVPEHLLHLLLEAEHDTLRGFGMRILARLSDAVLMQRSELLVVLAARPQVEVSGAALDLIRRLLPQDKAFAQHITLLLVSRLLSPKLSTDSASNLVHLLKQDCRDEWQAVPTESVWRLLRARVPQAQEFGGLLLPLRAQPEDFSVKQWVKLADHDILSIREAARHMCSAQLPRLREQMHISVKLLDAQWEDSRTFAFQLFREQFTKEDLTPSVLVSICDSVRPEVQQFGRQLLMQYFTKDDGQEYLLKLSEHPGADMQLFASHYLERYACDNPQRLAQLAPYFLAVLNKVNKGRIAKQRIYHFLEAEALKTSEAAHIIAPIVARQSVSMAISDKAATIRIMARIQQLYPEVELPLRRVS